MLLKALPDGAPESRIVMFHLQADQPCSVQSHDSDAAAANNTRRIYFPSQAPLVRQALRCVKSNVQTEYVILLLITSGILIMWSVRLKVILCESG